MSIITKITQLFSGSKTVAAVRNTWENAQPNYAIKGSFENMVREGYYRNELIFACIDKTAKTCNQLRLILRQPDGTVIPDTHPFIRLMRHPNPFMNEAEFYGSIVIYQKLAGRAIYEVERNQGGQPIALWPLRPDRIKIIADTKRPMPLAYTYELNGAVIATLKPQDVLDFCLFNPIDPLGAVAPASVAARTADVDNSVTDYLKIFFEKGGTPPGLITSKQRLKDVDVTRLRHLWGERYGGYEHWTAPVVLDSDAAYQAIGSSFKDMGFETIDARDEARICMVLQVPPILIGAKIGLDRSTMANFREARREWWEDTLYPMYEGWLDQLQSLLKQFDPNSTLEPDWDKSKIYAFNEDFDLEFKRNLDAWTRGAITRSEFRSSAGLEVEKTDDIYQMSNTSVYVPRGEDINEIENEPAPVIVPPAQPTTDEGDETLDEIEDDEKTLMADAMTSSIENMLDDDERYTVLTTNVKRLAHEINSILHAGGSTDAITA